ncbi:MAG: 30S ribosomal protein S15 [Chitinophagales bacterium]
MITAEKKKEIFKKFGANEKDTGSTKAQITLFTERIKEITGHLKNNKKDFSSTRSLINMVGKRKKLLKYLAKKDLEGYRALIKELNLRK